MSQNKERELQLARDTEANCTIMVGRSQRETVARAAIFYDGVIYSVERPGRHHNVIRLMMADGLPTEAMHLRYQGFVTNTGRFVDRYEAARIARAAGQIIREPTPPDMLTSEDVW